MSCSASRISQLIVDRLAEGEMRVLSLTISVRRGLSSGEHYKGDLPAAIHASLRKLIAARQVVETDGVYTLLRR